MMTGAQFNVLNELGIFKLSVARPATSEAMFRPN